MSGTAMTQAVEELALLLNYRTERSYPEAELLRRAAGEIRKLREQRQEAIESLEYYSDGELGAEARRTLAVLNGRPLLDPPAA